MASGRSYLFIAYVAVCKRNGNVFQAVRLGELLDYIRMLRNNTTEVGWLARRLIGGKVEIEDREALITAALSNEGELADLLHTGFLRPTPPEMELRFRI